MYPSRFLICLFNSREERGAGGRAPLCRTLEGRTPRSGPDTAPRIRHARLFPKQINDLAALWEVTTATVWRGSDRELWLRDARKGGRPRRPPTLSPASRT